MSNSDEEVLPSNIKSMCQHRILSHEEEIEYGTKALAGCQESANKLVTHNIRLVVHIAKQYVCSRMELGDAISVGTIGLMKAAKRYDPSRGTRFSTYAVWHIKDQLLKAYWECRSAVVRIPNYVANIDRKHARKEKLTKREESNKTKAEQARKFYSDIYDLSPENTPLSNSYFEDNSEVPTDLIDLVVKHLESLTPEDRFILKARFGIAPNLMPLTLEELGKIEGVCKERMRQKEVRAKERLQALVLEDIRGKRRKG